MAKYRIKGPNPNKNKWAVILPSGRVATWTISGTKKQSISFFLQELYWLENEHQRRKYWMDLLSIGARCVKMNITFEVCEKGKTVE